MFRDIFLAATYEAIKSAVSKTTPTVTKGNSGIAFEELEEVLVDDDDPPSTFTVPFMNLWIEQW